MLRVWKLLMWKGKKKDQGNKLFGAISELGSQSTAAAQTVPYPATARTQSPKAKRFSPHPDMWWQTSGGRKEPPAAGCWELEDSRTCQEHTSEEHSTQNRKRPFGAKE